MATYYSHHELLMINALLDQEIEDRIMLFAAAIGGY
jgi:hypothetical protein